tara:strand:+ start:288 stop:584 length:297 start_codon:yes stop_codon:yes gene_type:complete
MNESNLSIITLEHKIIGLLNKLKDNHLNLKQLEDSNSLLRKKNRSLEQRILELNDENTSLKVTNNLIGSSEGRTQTKKKISSLIKDVNYCIKQLSEIN